MSFRADVSRDQARSESYSEYSRIIRRATSTTFGTTKQTRKTIKSHISHVVLDSSWESSAAAQLEFMDPVICYAKNERLDFEIFYEWQGATHKYIPDYLIRMKSDPDDVTLILEIKGMETEQDRTKRAAAEKWVRAVNNHGGFGRWTYLQCRSPNQVRERIEALKL